MAYIGRWAGIMLVLTGLAGCVANAPGGFTRAEEDTESVSVRYRFDAERVDMAAMDADALRYCQDKGYDLASKLPATKGAVSGTRNQWYKCEWRDKKGQ